MKKKNRVLWKWVMKVVRVQICNLDGVVVKDRLSRKWHLNCGSKVEKWGYWRIDMREMTWGTWRARLCSRVSSKSVAQRRVRQLGRSYTLHDLLGHIPVCVPSAHTRPVTCDSKARSPLPCWTLKIESDVQILPLLLGQGLANLDPEAFRVCWNQR